MLKFNIQLTNEFAVTIEEMFSSNGKRKVWKFNVNPKNEGDECGFPSVEAPDQFWLKKRFRDELRNDLIKYIEEFQPKDPDDKNEIFKNRDRVDRVVANLTQEIESIIDDYNDSLTKNKWKQLRFNPELYVSVVGFLADLNNRSVADIKKHIEIVRDRKNKKIAAKGGNGEVTNEEVASEVLFIKPPKDVFSFFYKRLDLIIQTHHSLYQDTTYGKPIHRFKEELIICLATVLSFWLGRDPKWVLFIGPSRSFKSTHINFFQTLNKIITFEVDMMTANALMSGAEDVESFMHLLDEKCQLMDEMGTFLSMRKDVVIKLLSEYTVAYKGWASKASGSTKTMETVIARFNWLAGITNEKFQELYDLFRTIGSRFITFEFPVYAQAEWSYYHDLVDGKNPSIVGAKEKALKRMIGSYMYGMFRWLKEHKPIVKLDKVKDLLIEASNFYSIFRDREPPLWFRQMLTDLASTIATMFNRDEVLEEDVEILISSTYSCNKKVYNEIVKVFAANRRILSIGDIKEVLSTYKESHIRNIINLLIQREFLEEMPSGFMTRDKWRNIMEMIKKHMKRTGQYNAYTTSSSSQAKQEYLPAAAEEEGDYY